MKYSTGRVSRALVLPIVEERNSSHFTRKMSSVSWTGDPSGSNTVSKDFMEWSKGKKNFSIKCLLDLSEEAAKGKTFRMRQFFISTLVIRK